MPTKRFLMLTTGGTIAGNVADADAGSGRDHATEIQRGLDAILKPTLEEIRALWGVEVQIETFEVANVDSSNIEPKHWTQLATKIADAYDDFDGFIITHGTNTMGYTCAALSFALPNLNKPVAVTGSQVPYGRPASDALMNLENAVRTAAYPYQGGVRGVVCVFGSHIITGTRAKKRTEFDLDAFRSFLTPEIGRIGRIIQPDETNLAWHHSYLSKTKAPALMRRDLVVEAEFDTSILSLTEFPGLDPDVLQGLLEYLIEREDRQIKALVFRAFGAGDVSTRLHRCFEYLQTKEVPVVVTTQAPNGLSNFMVNEPGQALREHDLAIAAFDMSIEAITTKLAWLLGKNTPYREMKTQMQTDYHGEINVAQELA